MVGIEIANASKLVGIGLVGVESFQDNDLVGLDPGGFVDGPRVEAPEPEVAFGSNHIEGRCLMDGIKAIEVQISSVDDIEGSWFKDQLIEDPDIVIFQLLSFILPPFFPISYGAFKGPRGTAPASRWL